MFPVVEVLLLLQQLILLQQLMLQQLALQYILHRWLKTSNVCRKQQVQVLGERKNSKKKTLYEPVVGN